MRRECGARARELGHAHRIETFLCATVLATDRLSLQIVSTRSIQMALRQRTVAFINQMVKLRSRQQPDEPIAMLSNQRHARGQQQQEKYPNAPSRMGWLAMPDLSQRLPWTRLRPEMR